jgi:aspartyl-tRNA(Asn)/glutamyl-tRNA(Gln) amidotransferase subunit C
MISDIELKKLQTLARLSFSGGEAKEFSTKLESVLNMINQIHEVECQNVEPLRSVCEMSQRLREDKVNEANLSDDLFKNVPGKSVDLAREIKCFIVPKVVE